MLSPPGYGAPELLRKHSCIQSDIYSICMTFYVLRHHQFYRSSYRADAFDQLLIKGMQDDISLRYVSVQELQRIVYDFGRKTKKKKHLKIIILLLFVMLCDMSSIYLIHIYMEDKQSMLQHLAAAHRYDELLFYQHEVEDYQAMIAYYVKIHQEKGRLMALEKIQDLVERYQITIDADSAAYLMYQSILTSDTQQYQMAIHYYIPALSEKQCDHKVIEILTLAGKDKVIEDFHLKELDTDHEGVASMYQRKMMLLAFSKWNIDHFQQGYAFAIAACEWLINNAKPEDRMELRSLKDEVLYAYSIQKIEMKTDDAYSFAMQVIKEFHTIDSLQKTAALYLLVFENLIEEQDKPARLDLLEAALKNYQKLQKNYAEDHSIHDNIRQIEYLKKKWSAYDDF